MALISCPDCGTEVSDVAAACPKCARPITPAATTVGSSPAAKKKKGVGAGFTLVVFIALAAWIYYQANTPDQSSATDASQVSSTPVAGTNAGDAQAPQAAPAQARPVFVTTPADLYRAYSTNEVATNQALAGKTIQFTAPVLSIDEDFTNSAVLAFATGDQFNNLQATLKDSDKAAAAQLSPGQVVTVRCASFDRIMDSPMGSACTFQAGGEPSTDGSAAAAVQNVATDQAAAPPAAASTSPSAAPAATAAANMTGQDPAAAPASSTTPVAASAASAAAGQ